MLNLGSYKNRMTDSLVKCFTVFVPMTVLPPMIANNPTVPQSCHCTDLEVLYVGQADT